MRWTWREVVDRRMARQHLAQAPAAAIPSAAAAMCGAHAQVMSAAEVQLGIRVPGITRTDVRNALWRDGTLTKTFGPRDTVHLVPTPELGTWMAALGAIPRRSGQPPRNGGLTPEQLESVIAAIAAALDGTAALTVEELDAAVIGRTGSWAADATMPMFGEMAPRWRQAISRAAFAGALCFGPNRGVRTTYAKPPPCEPAADPEGTVLREYLHTYGPCAPRDFARWLSAPEPWAAEVFRRADLEPVTVEVLDGPVDLWVSAGDTVPTDAPARGIRLLPYFDPYVVGSHPRTELFPGRAFQRALDHGQAGNFPVLLVDGVVGGVWHQRRSGSRVAVTVEPIASLTRRQLTELDEQVQRLGEIVEATPTLTIGEITVGAHA